MSNIITGEAANNEVATCKAEADDDNIAKEQVTIVVINLNYVWDGVNDKWVRMTQP